MFDGLCKAVAYLQCKPLLPKDKKKMPLSESLKKSRAAYFPMFVLLFCVFDSTLKQSGRSRYRNPHVFFTDRG